MILENVLEPFLNINEAQETCSNCRMNSDLRTNRNHTVLEAPAKINLWLRLTGVQRPNGYNELRSHFAPLSLCDTLIIKPSTQFKINVYGPFAGGVPTDHRNVVHKAYKGFSKVFGHQTPIEIELTKNIPNGAGLGGGSADAGALLRYFAQAEKIPLPTISEWSQCIGADVPSAVMIHSGLVEGIGEILCDPLPLPKQRVLLVKPQAPCSTREVFKAWQKAGLPDTKSQNDLEIAAGLVCPEIIQVLKYLRSNINPNAQITGSGSACFALVPHGFQLTKAQTETLSNFWVELTDFRL